jgi:hypothetical protein
VGHEEAGREEKDARAHGQNRGTVGRLGEPARHKVSLGDGLGIEASIFLSGFRFCIAGSGDLTGASVRRLFLGAG